MSCIICGDTWSVSKLDSLCEECGVALADADPANIRFHPLPVVATSR
jgi:hypothetical protein